MYKKLFIMLLAAIMLLGVFQTSQAALQAVGPVSPATGYFPVWYQDATRQVELCLSKTPSPDPAAGGGAMCNLLPSAAFDPLLPIVFPLNFPDEAFWFTADAQIVDATAGVDVKYVSAIEAAFGTGAVANGDQITFARIRFFVQVPTAGTYIFTHPFGVDTFVVDTIDPVAREIQFTRDIGVATGIFTGALNGDIWPFLVRSNTPGGAPAPIVIGTETFLGDPNVLQAVTGSRFGTNFLRIQGPGIDITTDQFAISGKVFGGVLPSSLALDRTTYSRTAAGGVKVDVFATSAPGATLSFRETLAVGAESPMTADAATGRAFAQYAPAILPLDLVVTATQAGAPPTQLSSPVVDLVKLTKAAYNATTKELTIEAASSDLFLPLPTLTATGWGVLSVPPAGGVTQTLVVPNVLEPPARVTVASSAGGSDTEPVIVPLLNIPPIGVANPNARDSILWRHTAGGGENALWSLNGITYTGTQWIDGVPDQTWSIIGRADFNGDGQLDILWRHTTGIGENAVWYMNSTTHTGSGWIISIADQNWKIVGLGDFNGDAKPDLLWRNTTSGENVVWFMNGTELTGSAWLDSIADQAWTIAGTGDFNGDAKPDLLWRNTTSGENVVWHMNGTTRTASVWLEPIADQSWTVGTVGDFNGDVNVDIVWRNTVTGENLVWYMNGATHTGNGPMVAVTDQSWQMVK